MRKCKNKSIKFSKEGIGILVGWEYEYTKKFSDDLLCDYTNNTSGRYLRSS